MFNGGQSTLELMLDIRAIFDVKKIDEMEKCESAFKYIHANLDLLGCVLVCHFGSRL